MADALLGLNEVYAKELVHLYPPESTMEMTWENLMRLFTWAAKQGSDAPLADTAGEAIIIDGAVTKEDLERFLKSQSGSPAD